MQILQLQVYRKIEYLPGYHMEIYHVCCKITVNIQFKQLNSLKHNHSKRLSNKKPVAATTINSIGNAI
jgi:uncharacterized metal-binding protein